MDKELNVHCAAENVSLDYTQVILQSVILSNDKN